MRLLSNIGEADLKLLKEIYQDNLDYAMDKIKNHYPIQYLIGYVDFYNLKIRVNENVLIPRFETEVLVSEAIKYLKDKNVNNILDMATGSGCIAIALKKNLLGEVDACDISKEALEAARINAMENNIDINFFEFDILKDNLKKKYDCIISNPPYVRKNEVVSEETKFEPQIALYAENSGLIFYEAIMKQAKLNLNKHGYIILEIGATQAEEIKKIALSYFPKAKIEVLQDYNNFDRFMFIAT